MMSASGDNSSVRMPLIAAIALRFAELCRLIAAIALLLVSLIALQWLVSHASYVIAQEATAISQLKTLGSPAAAHPASAAQHFTDSRFTLVDVTVPIIGGLLSVDVPPLAWLLICIIVSIAVVVFVVSVWQQVITLWVQAQSCAWTSFLNVLGCIWAWIWVIISTIITVILTVLALLFVILNIAAFIDGL
jgi:hypothetical protein